MEALETLDYVLHIINDYFIAAVQGRSKSNDFSGNGTCKFGTAVVIGGINYRAAGCGLIGQCDFGSGTIYDGFDPRNKFCGLIEFTASDQLPQFYRLDLCFDRKSPASFAGELNTFRMSFSAVSEYGFAGQFSRRYVGEVQV